jgi:hypothetical protein
MPDFRLTEDEANRLSAYLTSTQSRELPHNDQLAAGNAERGRRHYVQYGCLSCHGPANGDDALTAVAATPLHSLHDHDHGCLARSDAERGRAPRFQLAAKERDALRAWIVARSDALVRDDPAEVAERMLGNLRCTHCHSRDDVTSVWPEVLADEGTQGLAAEGLPSLTWAGEKLQAAWLEKLFAGTLSGPSRPWLRARMPSFPAYASHLSAGLTAQHGYAPIARTGPAADPAVIHAGERLTQREQGFFCVECHAVGAQAALGAFAHHGVNFARVAERLNYDYYRRWIHDPLRVDPGTKMPKFSPDGLTTPKTEILQGRAAAQFDAIWVYLQSLNGR